MVLVFYKNLGSNMHSSNGSLYNRGVAVDQVSFSFVANYRQCQIVPAELLRHFCLQGYIAPHRTLCGLMATALVTQANCLCKKVNGIIPTSSIN